MKEIMAISAGGMIGALTRYYAGGLVQKLFRSEFFPYGTLIVNLSGCFFIGLVMETSLLKPGFPQNLRLFLVTGFTGAYTTFSTFEYETLRLMNAGNYKMAVFNILASNIFGLAAVVAGVYTAKILKA
ncbi:MAG: fluoride efflux transporter CrcB [Candidatus Wallbacteria bacterium]